MNEQAQFEDLTVSIDIEFEESSPSRVLILLTAESIICTNQFQARYIQL